MEFISQRFGQQFGATLILVLLLLLCLTSPVPSVASTGSNAVSGDTPDRIAGDNNDTCSDIDLGGQWQWTKSAMKSPAQIQGSAHWRSIGVPANWHSEYPWLSGVVWYRHEFDLPADSAQCASILDFQGVDYAAEVWLNRQRIGEHTGYFAPFGFLVKPQQLQSGSNVIHVRVDSPLEDPHDWSLRKTTVKGIFSHHDTRPGGAWSARGQERNTGGIWNRVSLLQFPQAKLGALQLTSVSDHKQQDWTLDVAADLYHHPGLPPEATAPDRFVLELHPQQPGAPALLVASGKIEASRQPRFSTRVDVHAPELWFPHGYGEQSLYRVRLTLFKQDHEIARSEALHGFRRVRFDEDSESFRINGKQFFVRGTNYISNQWLGDMTSEDYRRDIQLMQDANINAVRVHAHIERSEFYQLADRAGLLVWQDFPLQWGYSDSAEFRQEAVQQAREMVGFLGNHPSIVNWTLQNEPPFDAFWMKWKYPDYDANQNRQLVDAIHEAVAELDSSRWLLRFSATHTHPWYGWYSGHWSDYAKPSKVKWVTEFGAQALPALPSLRQMFFERDLWPTTQSQWDVWKYRNFQPRETFEIAGVAQGEDIHEFINNSQRYQSTVNEFAARSLRLQKYHGVNGLFQFMFVENWPSINWGVVDFWRNPKPAYHALAHAFQPLMPIIQWHKKRFQSQAVPDVPVWLVNDLWSGKPAAQLLLVLKRDGELIDQQSHTVVIEPDSLMKIVDYRLPRSTPGSYKLSARLMDAEGVELGTDEYTFLVDFPALSSVLD